MLKMAVLQACQSITGEDTQHRVMSLCHKLQAVYDTKKLASNYGLMCFQSYPLIFLSSI